MNSLRIILLIAQQFHLQSTSMSSPILDGYASEDNFEEVVSSPAATTRTVAIIKNHALNHRFDIEHRISEAGFEVRLSCFPIRLPSIPVFHAYHHRPDHDKC